MSKPVNDQKSSLKNLAKGFVDGTDDKLPQGIKQEEVIEFLEGVVGSPNGFAVNNYVGSPVPKDIQEEDGNTATSDEIELFDDYDVPLSPEQEKKYFYQQLVVACFDDMLSNSTEEDQEIVFKAITQSVDQFDEGGYLDEDESVSPASIYLRAKFSELQKNNPNIPSKLTYNQFRGGAQQIFGPDDNASDNSLDDQGEDKAAIKVAEILIGRGSEEDLDYIVEAARNIDLGDDISDNESVMSNSDSDLESVKSFDQLGSYEQQGVDDVVAALRRNRNPNLPSSSRQNNRIPPVKNNLSNPSRQNNRIPTVKNNLPNPSGQNNRRHTVFNPLRRSNISDNVKDFDNELDNEEDFEMPIYQDSNAILQGINAKFQHILNHLGDGTDTNIIAQNLIEIRELLQNVSTGLPDDNKFTALVDQVGKIAQDVAKIAKAKPTVASSNGVPVAVDMTQVQQDIATLADYVEDNTDSLKEEISNGRNEAQMMGMGLHQRFDDMTMSQHMLFNQQNSLESSVEGLRQQQLKSNKSIQSATKKLAQSNKELEDSIASLRDARADMSDTVDALKDISAKKHDTLRHLDHQHLKKYGYDQDLIPEIKGQVTDSHSGIEQHESCGIPVFVYKDMNEFSKDVENAARKPWPNQDNEKVVSSIARIEGKGYCTVTASNRGVSKTFLDAGQFEEMEMQAQKRYESVILAQAKKEDLEKVIKSLQEEKDLESDEEVAENISAVIDYLSETILGSLACALDPTKKMSAKDRDEAIENFNNWNCKDSLSNDDGALTTRKYANALKKVADGLSVLAEDERNGIDPSNIISVSDYVAADYKDAVAGYLRDKILQPIFDALDPKKEVSEMEKIESINRLNNLGNNLDEHLNDPILQAEMKVAALKRAQENFKASGWNEGVQHLQGVLDFLSEALNPSAKISPSDRNQAIEDFNNWTPDEDEFLQDNKVLCAHGVNQCSTEFDQISQFVETRDDVEKQTIANETAIQKAIVSFNKNGWKAGADHLQAILDSVGKALDTTTPQSEQDAILKEFSKWSPDKDEFLQQHGVGNEAAIITCSEEINSARVEIRRDSTSQSSMIYNFLNDSIADLSKAKKLDSIIIDDCAGLMKSSANGLDDEDERLRKLTETNKKVASTQKDSARRFASKQFSRDLVEDVKQSVKISEINDLDSSEVAHMREHMLTKMHGAEATVTGSNKNRRSASADKATEILEAPMPHSPKNGISFFRPRDSNTVTIAFNYDNVKGDKLDGDSLAYFHIPGTNEMYGRAQICKDPTKPMTVMKNGKEVLEYHKLGDVIIDPDTIFHRNSTGKYDEYGTAGTLWTDIESKFGDKGKNAVELYKKLGVKAMSQINRAGKGEEPDTERKVAVACEGQTFAYNGERQEENSKNVTKGRILDIDQRAEGSEEKALGKKKNAVDENGEEIEFRVGADGKAIPESKFAKLGKIKLTTADGGVEEVQLLTKISIDEKGNITHGRDPYFQKKKILLNGIIIEDLLCRKFCEDNTPHFDSFLKDNKGPFVDAINVDNIPGITKEQKGRIENEKSNIMEEFKARKLNEKGSISIAGKTYPVYDQGGRRDILIDVEPISMNYDNALKFTKDKVTQDALDECRNTKLVVAVVKKTVKGEDLRVPVVSAHDEFEGMGHRSGDKSKKEKVTMEDVVNLGSAPESHNFSHVSRIKGKGGGSKGRGA